jgi:hypothetical protein
MKFLGFVVLLYVLSPIDLIPDFIPVLVYLDELILVTLMVSVCLYFIPQYVMDDSIALAKELIKKEERLPQLKWGAILIALIWLGIIWYSLTYTNAVKYFL